MKRSKEFLETLFNNTKGYIELRTISPKGKVKQNWYDTTEIGRLLFDVEKSYFQKVNTYFGVCPRREEKGKEENIKQVNCLWVDLDCQNQKERKKRLDNLKSFKPSPSIIVCSGNGLHCYWLLEKPYLIKNNEDKLKAKGYLKGLAATLRGDKTFDLARILRVPGTKNVKDPKNPLPVEILQLNPTIRYPLSIFHEFKVKVEDTAIADIDTSLDEIPDRFWRVLEENTKLRNTWEGKRKDLKDDTRSGYDMSLATLLMPYNFKDSEIASILVVSPSGKGREAKRQYLNLTIGKAKTEWEKRKKEAEEREKPKEKPKRIFITGRQLVEEKIPELAVPIGRGFVVPERYTILAASDGEGKTTLCTQLALSVITGTPLLNFFPIPKPAKVLYFCGENSRGDIKAKFNYQKEELEGILKRKIIKDLEKWLIIVEPININFWLTQRDNQELFSWLEDHHPEIVIFDPLADFISSQKSLSDDTLARGTVKVLTELAQKYKCFPIITTHLKKEAINPNTGRSIVTLDNVWSFVHGSKYWLNSAAAQIVMIPAGLQGYKKAKRLVFKFKTVTEVEPMLILRKRTLWYEELDPTEMDKAKLTPEDVKDVLTRRCKKRKALPSILEHVASKELGCTQRQIRDLIKLGKKQGILFKNKNGEIENYTRESKNKLFNS